MQDDLTCPFLVVEQIGFELDKKFRETRLQLLLSPVLLRSGALSAKERTDGDGLLSQGHLLLTGLQFRGHGMFSELDRPLGSDTVEYAWLIEVHCGSLIGKITPAQLYNVFVSLEAFVFLAVDKENVLKHPRPFKICQHGASQKECKVRQRGGGEGEGGGGGQEQEGAGQQPLQPAVQLPLQQLHLVTRDLNIPVLLW